MLHCSVAILRAPFTHQQSLNAMYFALVLDFIFEQLADLLIYKLNKPLNKSIGSIFYKSDELDETLSDMGEDIWFDGVDKRLIEAHSKKVVLAKGEEKSLITKTPLLSYTGLLKKRKINQTNGSSQNGIHPNNNGASTSHPSNSDLSRFTIAPSTGATEEIALDCEMVECYSHKSVLARVSVVNLFGHPIFDSYVEPPAKVTDYRTKYSGIRKCDLENAPSFETIQKQIAKLIKDRIVVGHAIHNDFSALKLSHPTDKTRDTSHYFGRNYFLGKTPSLKKLCHSLLGITIQKGEHDSVQDAQATMKLYVKVREKWNEGVQKNIQTGKQKKQKTKPIKKKVKAFFVETI